MVILHKWILDTPVLDTHSILQYWEFDNEVEEVAMQVVDNVTRICFCMCSYILDPYKIVIQLPEDPPNENSIMYLSIGALQWHHGQLTRGNAQQLSKGNIEQFLSWISWVPADSSSDDHQETHDAQFHWVCEDKQSRSETKLEPQSSFKFRTEFRAL